MRFVNAAAADIPALRRLWMECFGDKLDYVNLYFDHSFDPARVFVLREEAIAAMCITFPVTYVAADGDEQPGAYLYAVCTAPAQRGKGLCRRLLRETEQALAAQGCAFTCLRAADPALAAMYEKMGYRARFTNQERLVSPAGASSARLSAPVWQTVAPADYYALRQFHLQGGFIDYEPAVLAHQARLGRLLSYDGGAAIAAVEQVGDRAICKEFLGDDSLLPGLAAQLGVDALTVRSPGKTPFAMAKALQSGVLPRGYLAFAFD